MGRAPGWGGRPGTVLASQPARPVPAPARPSVPSLIQARASYSTCRRGIRPVLQMRGRTRRPRRQGGSQVTETLSQHQTPACWGSAGKNACRAGQAAVLGSSHVPLGHSSETPRHTGPISPNVQTRKPSHRKAHVHRFQEGAGPHRPPWHGRLCSRGPEPSPPASLQPEEASSVPSTPVCPPARHSPTLCLFPHVQVGTGQPSAPVWCL